MKATPLKEIKLTSNDIEFVVFGSSKLANHKMHLILDLRHTIWGVLEMMLVW